MAIAEKAKILVVEDDEILRHMLGKILCHAGHEVVEAENGLEALGRVEHDPIDLVITDLIMPEMEGIETIRKLREGNASLPIIAISGGGWVGPQHYLEAAKRLGATQVLPKPFSMEAILGAVRHKQPKRPVTHVRRPGATHRITPIGWIRRGRDSILASVQTPRQPSSSPSAEFL